MIITSEQFNSAFAKLPYPIREFLVGDELGTIIQAIGKTYGLHVDTVGAVEREATNMLLGLINPEQFVAELKSAGVPAESIGPITQELNQKIFVPLRKKMQETPPEPEEEPESDESPAAPASISIPAATVPVPQVPVFEPQPPQPSAAIPLYSNSPAPVAPPFVPTPQPPAFQTPTAPLRPTPPAVSIPQSQPTPQKAPASSSENKEALYNVMKEYGVDPYRESPE
jgi:hypothetical protein